LREILLHGEPSPPSFVPHLLACYKCIERYLFVLCPNASGRAEIGNSALGRNTCPGKGNDDRSIFDQLPQARDRSGKIGGDHLCIVDAFCQSVRFSLCDICTLCCAFEISTLRSIFIATSWEGKNPAAGWMRKTGIPWCSWPARPTKNWLKQAKLPADPDRNWNSPTTGIPRTMARPAILVI